MRGAYKAVEVATMKPFVFLLLITAVVSYGQTPAEPKAKSDAEKIASALRAGPKFVTRNATILDWPTSTGAEFRVLLPEVMGGPVFRVLLEPPMMSPAVLTRSFSSS